MKLTHYSDFIRAVQDAVKKAIPTQEAHKKDAVFVIGNPHQGYSLRADGMGWYALLDGVRTAHGVDHIASPLTNLQAAALHLDH